MTASAERLDIGLAVLDAVRREGQGRVMLELARELVSRGHDVTLYAHRVDDDLRPSLRFVEIPRLPGPQIVDDLWMCARTTPRVRRAHHDIVCVLGPCAFPRGPWLFDAQFSHRGWRATWTRATRPALRHRLSAFVSVLLEDACARRATAVIVSSGSLAADLARPGVAPLEIVPDGVDLDEFTPATPEERSARRAEFGVGDDERVIAFLGEYKTTRKGLDPLLRALALGSDERLLVAARGDDAQLRARLDDLGIQDRVAVLGFAPARSVLAAADVLAVPSFYEPFSLVALEAAAMGIPVVLSRRAGVAEHLADAAVLVDDPADPAELRRALDEVRGDPARAAAAAGRDVARRLTWSATSARGADVLERWAGSREVAAGHR